MTIAIGKSRTRFFKSKKERKVHMATKTERPVTEIKPNEHPHVFLGHFGEPYEGLTVDQAIMYLHLKIATADHDELIRVSDTVTAFLAPRDSTHEERSQIALAILRDMLSIRKEELSA